MNNNEQFKIDTIDELKQAYEMFKEEWVYDTCLKQEKHYFNLDSPFRWIVKNSSGKVYLFKKLDRRKTIPSPLHQPQYPCEMLVSSDNCNWHKRTVIAKYKNEYYALNEVRHGSAVAWSHAKPIPKTIELTKAEAKAIIRDDQNIDHNTEIIITD